GHQVLLNYRSSGTSAIAPQVTLTQVLHNQINPNAIKDRIVLIGVSAPSYQDYLLTPYGRQPDQEMPGIMVQAQMVSQILSAVLDQRPLLWVWPRWSEVLWVWGWSLVGGLIARWNRAPLRLGLTGAKALGTLYGLCLGLLIQGGWVPLVPAALALIATGGSVVAYRLRTQASNQDQESK
ncbi:MAG TPA: CHASE2 domain-containing protein, partial [Candidatus Caenarcaniphilales bacterium]